jgi:transcriptional regulator with XRE-family HTH domain
MSNWIGKINSQIDYEILEESALAMAQSTIQGAINDSGLSKADMARRMCCNRSVVSRILNGHHNLTVKTMARALAACGSEVRFERVPIQWNWGVLPQFQEQVPAHAGTAIVIGDTVCC